MKLTPPERYARKYCTPVVFARFVCALLDFCAHNFPAKPEKKLWTFIVDQRLYIYQFLEQIFLNMYKLFSVWSVYIYIWILIYPINYKGYGACQLTTFI